MDESAEVSIQRILDGAFTIAEEADLVKNIRSKLSLPLTLEKILDILVDCSEDELTVEACKAALISA